MEDYDAPGPRKVCIKRRPTRRFIREQCAVREQIAECREQCLRSRRSQHLYDLDSGVKPQNDTYEKKRDANMNNVRKIKNNSQTLSFLRRQE